MANRCGQLTRAEFETALDAGRLEVEMANGRWWKVRRNGRTWIGKRDATKWRIPVKAGLRSCMTVNDNTSTGFFRFAD